MGELTKFPWEQLPAIPMEETLLALQRDVAYMVTHTAILVRSGRTELQMLVNTPRGQIVPRGECRFTDGSTFELQDIGMPQPGVPHLTVQELMARIWTTASELGLGLS